MSKQAQNEPEYNAEDARLIKFIEKENRKLMVTPETQETLQKILDQDSGLKMPKAMSIGIYLYEADVTFRNAVQHSKDLKQKGLMTSEIRLLPGLIRKLADAEAEYQDALKTRKAMMSPERMLPARKLMAAMLRQYRFAYRNNVRAMFLLKYMSPQSRWGALSGNLSQLASMPEKDPAPLQAINFDFDNLQLLRKMSEELVDIKASRGFADGDAGDALKARNTAYTELKKALDRVRDYGKFVFPLGDPRREGYVSGYLRAKRRKLQRELDAIKQAAQQAPPRTTAAEEQVFSTSSSSQTEARPTTPNAAPRVGAKKPGAKKLSRRKRRK